MQPALIPVPTLFAFLPAMTDRALAIVLALGLVAVFIALVVMVWTRWGQARPMAKCAGLSFAAHALLLIYAYSTQVLFEKPGSLFGQTVKVYVPDAHDNEEAAPHPEVGEPKPWDQPGLDQAADLNAPAPAPMPMPLGTKVRCGPPPAAGDWARGAPPPSGGRAVWSRYPHTPQNRAVGSIGELQDGQFIQRKFSQKIRGFASMFPTFCSGVRSSTSSAGG